MFYPAKIPTQLNLLVFKISSCFLARATARSNSSKSCSPNCIVVDSCWPSLREALISISNTYADPTHSNSSPSSQTDIEFRLVYRTMPVIRYLLAAWRRAGLSLDQVSDDLRANGFSEEKADRSRRLLGPLEAVKE